MSSMMTVNDVWDRVINISKGCHDREVDVRAIMFESVRTVVIDGVRHLVRPVAQRQMAMRLGIPLAYLEKCPEDLQAENLNHWIRQERNEKLFFRFDLDEVRAIFTLRYRPVDNHRVMDMVDLAGFPVSTPVQCAIDAEFMSLSIPDGSRAFHVNGDRMTPGISIVNSEVGLASLSVSAFVLRLVCTNGLIARTEVTASYRHVSAKILDEFPEVMARVEGEVGKQQDRLRLSMESRVENPSSTIESFNRQFALGKPEKEAVDWAWPQEAGDTMFHIVNTYTRASQFQPLTAESSHRLQRVGGDILGMLKES